MFNLFPPQLTVWYKIWKLFVLLVVIVTLHLLMRASRIVGDVLCVGPHCLITYQGGHQDLHPVSPPHQVCTPQDVWFQWLGLQPLSIHVLLRHLPQSSFWHICVNPVLHLLTWSPIVEDEVQDKVTHGDEVGDQGHPCEEVAHTAAPLVAHVGWYHNLQWL